MEKLKLLEILYWEVHQKSAGKNDFGESRAKFTLHVETCVRL
jgi:hypothetical protein